MKNYEPELGQAVFGQPYKEYQAPEWLISFLTSIDLALCLQMWNKNQKEYDSPFANTGNKYKNEVFELEAFKWDDKTKQPFNFKWKDLEISWYKYLGRGTTVNREITPDEGVKMLNECLASIGKIWGLDDR